MSDPTKPGTEGPGAELPAWQRAAKAQVSAAKVRTSAVAATKARARESGYLAAHWRGEQSLVRSFWLNNVLASMPLGFALTALMGWISVKGQSLQISAIVSLLAWPLLLAFNVWCIVGGWRAAGSYLRILGGTPLWGWLARLALAVGALQLTASVMLGFLPEVGGLFKLARGIDPIGHASFTLSADGHTLQWRGPIGMGDASRLQAAIQQAPALRRVELSSPGGRVYEAERAGELLRQGRYDTRAVGNCESACTLVFLAGKERQLMPGAQLGFHRASSGTFNPVFDELAQQHLAGIYRNVGLPESFIRRAGQTPGHGMWYPSAEELADNALIARLPQTLDVSLPAGADATAADFADALRLSPVWQAVETRYAGTLAAAAERMRVARAAAADDDVVQAQALEVLAPKMAELIGASTPALRRQYAQIVHAQLKALTAPPAKGAQGNSNPGKAPVASREQCQALLAGLLAPRRQLPTALQVQEATWLINAAQADAPRWLPRAPTAIELEVMRRSLGPQAPAMLAGLWPSANPTINAPANPARCDTVLKTLDRLASLPVAQRELAERLMFQAL